jgi:phosphodiesterase/alkaline phosphatase D-like protein
MSSNPNLLFASSERRGYLLLDVDNKRLQAQLVAMESVSRPEAGRSLLATFVVESGKPGPVRA